MKRQPDLLPVSHLTDPCLTNAPALVIMHLRLADFRADDRDDHGLLRSAMVGRRAQAGKAIRCGCSIQGGAAMSASDTMKTRYPWAFSGNRELEELEAVCVEAAGANKLNEQCDDGSMSG